MSEVVIRSASPTPVGQMLSPWRMVTGLARHGVLIRKFAARDVVEMYKGSYLGLVWVVAQPLLLLSVYTFVFSVVLKGVTWKGAEGELSGHWGFALMFFTGHVLYQVFQTCATRAPEMLVNKRNLVQRVVFPIEILPVAVAGSALFYAAVGVGLLIVAALALAGIFSWTIVLLPLVFLPLVMLSLGASWLLATVGVFIRDTKSVVDVAVMLLYFMTPIFYTVDVVPADFQWVMRINPLTTIVEAGRDVVLRARLPDFEALGIVTLAAAVVMQLGYFSFMKSKRVFADVI